MDVLAERLSRQQLLMVLDNCEHVVDAAAELCEALLAAADDIQILATSREPLGLAGEARYRLPPLTLPSTRTPGGTEAVELFVERARQLDADFTAEGDEGVMLARLVRRLDGLPLAIELAAARVEASEADRQGFRRLAVISGPFTLNAAEAVAGPEADQTVLRLVDCSLLMPPVTGPDGRFRYLMLETLRDFGLRQLKEAGEEPGVAAALAAHALDVADQAAAEMAVPSGERAAALRLDAEDAIVHQGLAWALEHDPPTALRLAVGLAQWWMVRGR